MASSIRMEVEKLPTHFINTKINSEVYKQFQIRCKQQNIPMNVVIEAFARQYASGRYKLEEKDIVKWENDSSEGSVLSTAINKDVYVKFKEVVVEQEFYVKHVLTAFAEDYGKRKLVLEFIEDDM
jgi:hypothetical protein